MDTRTLLQASYLQVADRHCVDLGRLRLAADLQHASHCPASGSYCTQTCWPLCITPAYARCCSCTTPAPACPPDALPHTPPGAPAPAQTPLSLLVPLPVDPPRVHQFGEQRFPPAKSLSQRVTTSRCSRLRQATLQLRHRGAGPRLRPAFCPSPANARRHRSAGASARVSFHHRDVQTDQPNANADGRSLEPRFAVVTSRRGSPSVRRLPATTTSVSSRDPVVVGGKPWCPGRRHCTRPPTAARNKKLRRWLAGLGLLLAAKPACRYVRWAGRCPGRCQPSRTRI